MSPILGIWASAQQPALNAGAYESIATSTVGAGGAASVTFSSIPQTYKHLEIRYIDRNANTAVDFNNTYAQFNGDTGNNYTQHTLYGFGSTYGAGGTSSAGSAARVGVDANDGLLASAFAAGVCTILDYTNTNKYKTTRSLSGINTNTTSIASQGIYLASSLWLSTSAITSIKIYSSTGNDWKQYSTFALYGIKG